MDFDPGGRTQEDVSGTGEVRFPASALLGLLASATCVVALLVLSFCRAQAPGSARAVTREHGPGRPGCRLEVLAPRPDCLVDVHPDVHAGEPGSVPHSPLALASKAIPLAGRHLYLPEPALAPGRYLVVAREPGETRGVDARQCRLRAWVRIGEDVAETVRVELDCPR